MNGIIQIAEALGLTEPQKNKLTEWITTRAKETNLNLEIVDASLLKYHLDAVKVDLISKMSLDQYLEYLKSSVNGDLADMIHRMTMEFTVYGHYPPRKWDNGSMSCDFIGKVKMEEKIYPLVLTTSGEDVDRLINEAVPFSVYKTEVQLDPRWNDNKSIFLKATGLKSTIFGPETEVKSPTWLGDKRIQEVLSKYPLVPLRLASQFQSQLVTQKGGKLEVVETKPITEGTIMQKGARPNPVDLRAIQVTIKGFKKGINKNGTEWGLLTTVDNTFIPTVDSRYFAVWIDPLIVRKMNVGPESYVTILGTLQYDYQTQRFVQMNACCLVPIKIVPLQVPAANLGGTGGVQNLSM